MNEIITATCDQFLAGYHREQEGLEHHWQTHDERGRLTAYGMGVDRAQKEARAEQERPLGRLANADLRKAKAAAHAAFDPIWQNGYMNRKQAYSWLSKQLDSKEAVHIGTMDVTDCGRVVAVSTYYLDMKKAVL